MKTKDFLKKHDACLDGAKWALSISDDMADVWDALIEQGKYEWLIWTATRPGVFSDSELHKLACRFVRETPLMDGRVVWDLLTDERSCRAVEVAEAYIDGKATDEELRAARVSAYDAVHAARAAAHVADAAAYVVYAADAAYDAACAAADPAAYVTARAAADAAANADADAQAKAAQIKMIAEIGNPFRKGQENE